MAVALGPISASFHLEMTPQQLLVAAWPSAWAQLSRKGFNSNRVTPRPSFCPPAGRKGCVVLHRAGLGWDLLTGLAQGGEAAGCRESWVSPSCLLLHDKMT